MFVAFGTGASLSWYFHKTIIAWLLIPAREQLSATGPPIFTSPTEMFALAVRLAMMGGVVVAFPVLAFHIARFASPLLSPRLRWFVAIFLPAGFVCYLVGVAFAYFVLLPTGLGFLLQFGTDVAVPMIRITEYMDLALAMLFWLGVVFELPLAMFLLAKLRVVSYERFRRLHRYVPPMATILGAIITPGVDPISWSFVAVPLILLFEVGLFLTWLVRPRQPSKLHRNIVEVLEEIAEREGSWPG